MEGPDGLGARDGTSSNLSATTLGAGAGAGVCQRQWTYNLGISICTRVGVPWPWGFRLPLPDAEDVLGGSSTFQRGFLALQVISAPSRWGGMHTSFKRVNTCEKGEEWVGGAHRSPSAVFFLK